MANKASTLSRQSSLSADALDTSLQLLHSALSLSLSVVLLHVVLGLPRLQHPSDAHIVAFPQSLSSPFLLMGPMSFHLLLLTSSPMFSMSAISITSLLVILSCQHILSIRLRHLFWKTSNLFSSVLFIFHVSQPYIKTGLTRVFYSLILARRRTLLVLQIFLNFRNTPLALSNLSCMSCVSPPSLETVAPRQTNLSTSSTSTREFIRSSSHFSTTDDFQFHLSCFVG